MRPRSFAKRRFGRGSCGRSHEYKENEQLITRPVIGAISHRAEQQRGTETVSTRKWRRYVRRDGKTATAGCDHLARTSDHEIRRDVVCPTDGQHHESPMRRGEQQRRDGRRGRDIPEMVVANEWTISRTRSPEIASRPPKSPPPCGFEHEVDCMPTDIRTQSDSQPCREGKGEHASVAGARRKREDRRCSHPQVVAQLGPRQDKP